MKFEFRESIRIEKCCTKEFFKGEGGSNDPHLYKLYLLYTISKKAKLEK